MSEREQLRQVCGWNRQLSRTNSSLRADLHRARREIERLEAVNARLGVQAEAAECFLDAAMDMAAEAA